MCSIAWFVWLISFAGGWFPVQNQFAQRLKWIDMVTHLSPYPLFMNKATGIFEFQRHEICTGKNEFLKTLFNIVEDRFNFFFLWRLCCIMMFRWINKQPGMQKFWNWCSHYQEIYDWVSSSHKQSGLPFILIQQCMGETSMVNLVTCLFSLFWSTSWCFWCTICFQGFNFTPYQRHW